MGASFDLEAAVGRAWDAPGGTPAGILRAAEQLFAERGFKAVTIRDIAAAAGINVSTLHFHWKTKATLYEALFHYHDRFLFDFLRRMEEEATAHPIDTDGWIARWVDWIFTLAVERPAVFRLSLQALTSEGAPETSAVLRYHVRVLNAVGLDLLERHQKSDADALDPPVLTFAIFSLGALMLADLPFQRAMLGGSFAESDELRGRLEEFGRRLLRRLISTDPPRAHDPGESR